MADETELLEYLKFLEVLNAGDERVVDMDVEADGSNYIEMDCVEAMDVVDHYEELDKFSDSFESFEDTPSEILQCIVNMIELEYILNKNVEVKQRKRRRWGVHPINQLRREYGHFENLCEEMSAHDPEKFFNFTRMTPERFKHLLTLVGPKITKYAPNAIPPKGRLLLTLRYVEK